MNILPKRDFFRDVVLPSVKLQNTILRTVVEYKYLGHLLRNDLSDDADIRRFYRSVCARGNQLTRKFGFCTDLAKIHLFKSYCTSFYCSSFWSNYKKYNINTLIEYTLQQLFASAHETT